MSIDSSIEQWGIEMRMKFASMNFTPAIPAIKQVIRSSIIKNFAEGGRYGNSPWGGGSSRWIQSNRAANKDKGQTLRHKGVLLNSIRVEVTQSGGQLIIEIGSNQPYAAIHNFGFNQSENVSAHFRIRKGKKFTVKGSKAKAQNISIGKVEAFTRQMNMPARPYLVIQEEDIYLIQSLIAGKLNQLLP